jgi:hypothetical protein
MTFSLFRLLGSMLMELLNKTCWIRVCAMLKSLIVPKMHAITLLKFPNHANRLQPCTVYEPLCGY